MCPHFHSDANVLLRDFHPSFIQMPHVVAPMLDCDTSFLRSSIGWDSDSDEETQSGQDQMEDQKKKAKEDPAAEETK